jgi:hypothetical protein
VEKQMNEYVLDVAGIEHTVLLDDDEAERLGAKAKAPENKAREASDKKSSPANKSRG